MRYVLAVLAAVFLHLAARPAMPADPAPGPQSAFGRLSGELVRVRDKGKDLTVEDSSGERTRVSLPPELEVQRRIGMGEIGAGEPVHVQFKSFGGTEEVYLMKVERVTPGSPASDHDPRIRKPPQRFWGRVVSVSAKSREITIRHPDGEVRSFAVRLPAFIYARASVADLKRGDSVRVILKIEEGEPRPVRVMASSKAALKEFKEAAGEE